MLNHYDYKYRNEKSYYLYSLKEIRNLIDLDLINEKDLKEDLYNIYLCDKPISEYYKTVIDNAVENLVRRIKEMDFRKRDDRNTFNNLADLTGYQKVMSSLRDTDKSLMIEMSGVE